MTVQETKWSEAAVSEAIESTVKAMGYDTLKLHYTSELIEDYVNNYIPKLQKLYSVFTRPFLPHAEVGWPARLPHVMKVPGLPCLLQLFHFCVVLAMKTEEQENIGQAWKQG